MPPAALAEASALKEAPRTTEEPTRDLRTLLWCSIDNDDSRDLDQLSVSEALPGGQVKVMVAIADVDAAVEKNSAVDRHAATEHDVGLHAGRDVPDAARAAVDRSDVAQPSAGSPGDGDRIRRDRGRRAGELAGVRRRRSESREARLQRRRRLAGWDGTVAASGGGRAGDGRAAANAGRRRSGPPAAALRARRAGVSDAGSRARLRRRHGCAMSNRRHRIARSS